MGAALILSHMNQFLTCLGSTCFFFSDPALLRGCTDLQHSSLSGLTLDVFVYLSFELKGFFFPQCVLTFMEFFFSCRHF